ncbi:putative MAPEG superfamily protein [Rhizobium azooxidifex]|uniref:Putative MAPEG superfamily protein n=1 Tax=Mycoplana azooxidifex TaxID=1636188 RepID=A0A7W6GJ71_9HYPH|nr:MAPEG family protein [Mycoplana azooxidifex]MBB3976848.1 putative MAPEG superfamily protein [Mycoplana azooxidifex]
MDAAALATSPFLTLVAWSAALLVFQVMLQGALATHDRGADWNAGPRDGEAKPLGKLAGRVERASANLRETYPAFIGLALALALSGDPSGWGYSGALLWFACRILYIPLYLAGIAYVRSLIWLGSLAGLFVMFAALVL